MEANRHVGPRKSVAEKGTRAPLLTESEELVGSTPNSCGPARIPPQWSSHYRALTKLRERLMHSSAEQAGPGLTTPNAPSQDAAETAQEQADLDLMSAKLGSEVDQLFEVDCALQRICDGTYGFCEKTGHPIPVERLRAVPWTRYALDAARPIARRSVDARRRPR